MVTSLVKTNKMYSCGTSTMDNNKQDLHNHGNNY